MIIIPAIDIIDGRCVRLSQGDFSRKTVYAGNPVDVARQFQDAGCTRLHVVDLDGARQGRLVNYATVEQLASATSMAIDVGGGIRTRTDVAMVLASGAQHATVGSIAVQNKAELLSWIQEWGADAFILGIDVMNGRIAVHGWEQHTDMNAQSLLSGYASAVRCAICTDIAYDGMLGGAAIAWYTELRRDCPWVDIIASGGVSSMRDIELVESTGVRGVVVGRALYEGRISLRELEVWNSKQKGGDA